jgi:hypothetical protein
VDQDKIKYWKDTIAMMERAHKPRVKRWNELKERLGTQFEVKGVKDPVIISRFYKIVRETIASVAFKYPHVFLQAEDDPADPMSGEVLRNSSDILEDFANDGLEVMDCKPRVQQAIFDTLFCSRGWIKMGFSSMNGAVAPYVASDRMPDDFTYISRVKPENILIDPLTSPEDMCSARYIVEVMYPGLSDLIADDRFSGSRRQLQGLKNDRRTGQAKPFEDADDDDDDETREVLLEAHRLAGTVKMYEIHDRVNQRRICFVEGIEQPVEDIDHPFIADVVENRPDPSTGRPLLALADMTTGAEGVTARKKFLVEGGFPYFSTVFDVSDDFYPEPMMAYENPIQNAIIKSISRRLDILDRFKRMGKTTRAEVDNNPDLLNKLKNPEDGEMLVLDDINALQEVNWGSVPADQLRIEQDMLRYESEIVRTTSNSNPGTATEAALSASETQLNREFNQQSVENAYIWIVRNMFTILSDDRYTPQRHNMRLTSVQGAQMIEAVLKSWMLRGVFNINIAAGSMNVLYESMQKDKALSMVNFLRQSPNVDQKELDKMIIRAHGEVDPDKLMKPDSNVDAAKAAELEIQMFFSAQHDPGVTQGEDHDTHIGLQNPNAIQQRPDFAGIPPMLKQRVLQVANQHFQAHQQALQQEAGRSGGPVASSSGPEDLQSQVASNAQKTANAVEQSVKG